LFGGGIKPMLKVVPKFEAYQMRKSTFILSIIIITNSLSPTKYLLNDIEKKIDLKICGIFQLLIQKSN
jgi:hypothetical protein